MTVLFALSSLLHISYLIWCRVQWGKILSLDTKREDKSETFSIIVPVRNEATHIGQLVTGLCSQHYPSQNYEILIVDDHSEDDTYSLALHALEQGNISYGVFKLEGTGQMGKKQAISFGVTHARYEYILTIDGDCEVSEGWLAAYADAYSRSSANMITGPVRMEADTPFERMQALEFACLVGYGAATLRAGLASMCNGANLSYRKEVFASVGGYTGNEHIPSGDDEFLLQRVCEKHGKVFFLKNAAAMVTTSPKPTLKAFVTQRVRWSSKWKHHSSIVVRCSAMAFFVDMLLMIATLPTLAVGHSWWTLLPIYLMRLLAFIMYARPVASFFNVKAKPQAVVGVFLFYPLVVLFLGIASIFGKYTWKGRKYHDG